MPQVDYTATIEVPRPTVWDFVRDMNNWAPFATGYQEHEVIDDRESLWTVKGDVGPISRTTRFRVIITEWVEQEKVAFTLEGLNEPIKGEGAILLVDGEGSRTDIRADAGLEFGGSMGPIISPLIGPWIKAGADDLVTQIAVALQPDYQKPKKPFFLAAWWQSLLRAVRGLFGGDQLEDAGTAVAEPPAATVSVSEPMTTPSPQPQQVASPSGLKVETLLLGPSLEQYTGTSAGIAAIGPIRDAAVLIEELGFDGVTTPEAGHDPFLPLMIAAEHTERILLGTNVAIAFPRSPMVSAQIAWDLQRFSGGRFRMGLGTQVKGHNERRYSTPWTGPPGPRLRDYLLCMKAMFHNFRTGEPPRYEGEYYRFTLMSPFFSPGQIEHPDPKLYISALNPYMARLTGELCDGVRLHPLASHAFTRDVVAPALQRGLEKAERARAEVDLVATPFLVSGRTKDEVEAAKAGVKQQIAFYSSTRTYHSVLEHHGWGEVGQTLHTLSVEGKWTEMRDQITDEMLDTLAIVATYDELVPRIKERWGSVCDTVFLGFPPNVMTDKALVRGIVEGLQQG